MATSCLSAAAPSIADLGGQSKVNAIQTAHNSLTTAVSLWTTGRGIRLDWTQVDRENVAQSQAVVATVSVTPAVMSARLHRCHGSRVDTHHRLCCYHGNRVVTPRRLHCCHGSRAGMRRMLRCFHGNSVEMRRRLRCYHANTAGMNHRRRCCRGNRVGLLHNLCCCRGNRACKT